MTYDALVEVMKAATGIDGPWVRLRAKMATQCGGWSVSVNGVNASVHHDGQMKGEVVVDASKIAVGVAAIVAADAAASAVMQG